jgi:hypothetical protein
MDLLQTLMKSRMLTITAQRKLGKKNVCLAVDGSKFQLQEYTKKSDGGTDIVEISGWMTLQEMDRFVNRLV